MVTDVLTTSSELQGADLEASRSVRQALKSRRRLTEIISEDAHSASSFSPKLGWGHSSKRSAAVRPRETAQEHRRDSREIQLGQEDLPGSADRVVTDVLMTCSELQGVVLEASRSVR